MEEQRIKLNVLGVTFSQVQAGAYALILAEESGTRRIPIIIGTPEAQSIAIFLEGLRPPRPLTHELFLTFAERLHASLKEIFIYKYEEGVFFSELVFVLQDNEEIIIDSRTSDAIALAIRTDSPIYMTEDIMKEAGIILEEDVFGEEEESDNESQEQKPQQFSYDSMSLNELEDTLNDAISMENYEKASLLRDLIKKKKERKERK